MPPRKPRKDRKSETPRKMICFRVPQERTEEFRKLVKNEANKKGFDI